MWKVWWKKNTRPSADRASFIFFNEEYFDSSYEEFRRNLDLLREGRFSRLSAKNTDILSLGGRPTRAPQGSKCQQLFQPNF